MKVFEASLEISVDQYSNAADLILSLGRAVADQIAPGEQVVRFVVTSQSASRFFCELGILTMPLARESCRCLVFGGVTIKMNGILTRFSWFPLELEQKSAVTAAIPGRLLASWHPCVLT
jgi:hypothetical protein